MKNLRFKYYRNQVLRPYTIFKERLNSGGQPDASLQPHFLGIGGHKCGSTWLYQNLKAHPEIFLPEIKELHYFDREFHRSFRFYLKNFKGGEQLLRGEITPAYGILSKTRIAFIKNKFPELKILFMIRNPGERAWSHALMAFVTWQKRDFNKISDDEFIHHFHLTYSTLRTDYDIIYKNWSEAFGEENIWVGFYDDITADPEQLLKDCFTFLNVAIPSSFEKFPLRTYFNKGPGHMPSPKVQKYLDDMYREKIKSWEPVFGQRVLKWIKS